MFFFFTYNTQARKQMLQLGRHCLIPVSDQHCLRPVRGLGKLQETVTSFADFWEKPARKDSRVLCFGIEYIRT